MRIPFQPIRVPQTVLASACAPVLRDAVSRNVVKCQRQDGSRSSAGETDPSPRVVRGATPAADTGSHPVSAGRVAADTPARRGDAVARADRLSPRQLTAAELLLAGCTVTATATRLNVNPRTIFRWLNDVRFAAEIDRRADLAERFRRAHRSLDRGGAQVP